MNINMVPLDHLSYVVKLMREVDEFSSLYPERSISELSDVKQLKNWKKQVYARDCDLAILFLLNRSLLFQGRKFVDESEYLNSPTLLQLAIIASAHSVGMGKSYTESDVVNAAVRGAATVITHAQVAYANELLHNYKYDQLDAIYHHPLLDMLSLEKENLATEISMLEQLGVHHTTIDNWLMIPTLLSSGLNDFKDKTGKRFATAIKSAPIGLQVANAVKLEHGNPELLRLLKNNSTQSLGSLLLSHLYALRPDVNSSITLSSGQGGISIDVSSLPIFPFEAPTPPSRVSRSITTKNMVDAFDKELTEAVGYVRVQGGYVESEAHVETVETFDSKGALTKLRTAASGVKTLSGKGGALYGKVKRAWDSKSMMNTLRNARATITAAEVVDVAVAAEEVLPMLLALL